MAGAATASPRIRTMTDLLVGRTAPCAGGGKSGQRIDKGFPGSRNEAWFQRTRIRKPGPKN